MEWPALRCHCLVMPVLLLLCWMALLPQVTLQGVVLDPELQLFQFWVLAGMEPPPLAESRVATLLVQRPLQLQGSYLEGQRTLHQRKASLVVALPHKAAGTYLLGNMACIPCHTMLHKDHPLVQVQAA